MIPIVIMTYGRANLVEQHTWRALPETLRKRVIFACRPEEAPFFSELAEVFVLSAKCVDLKSTRQEIWDTFASITEFWYLLDDDVKAFRKITSVDINRKPIFETEVIAGERIAGVFNCLEKMMTVHEDIATCSPRQFFRPPRVPQPGNRWNTSLVVGFNLFRSKACRDIEFKFLTNYCGDAEMVLNFLAHGWDTVWHDTYSVLLAPPTTSAKIRETSQKDWAETVSRLGSYIKFNEGKPVRHEWSSSLTKKIEENPAKLYTMQRAKLLKDARAGTLKPITLTRDV